MQNIQPKPNLTHRERNNNLEDGLVHLLLPHTDLVAKIDVTSVCDCKSPQKRSPKNKFIFYLRHSFSSPKDETLTTRATMQVQKKKKMNDSDSGRR